MVADKRTKKKKVTRCKVYYRKWLTQVTVLQRLVNSWSEKVNDKGNSGYISKWELAADQEFFQNKKSET